MVDTSRLQNDPSIPIQVTRTVSFNLFYATNLFLNVVELFKGARTRSSDEFVNKTSTNRTRAGDSSHLGLYAAKESRSHGYPAIDNDFTQPVSTGITRFKVKYGYSIDSKKGFHLFHRCKLSEKAQTLTCQHRKIIFRDNNFTAGLSVDMEKGRRRNKKKFYLLYFFSPFDALSSSLFAFSMEITLSGL